MRGSSPGMVLSVIIPIYNEERGLPELIERVLSEAAAAEPRMELILVNDGSLDTSEEIILAHARKDPRVKLISLSRNFGHHPAVQAGMDHCRGAATVLMDGDFQDPPEMIPDLVARWREGYEVVYTRKSSRDEPPVRRFLFNTFYRVFNQLSAMPIEPGVGIFSLLDRRALEVLRSMPERHKYLAGMRQWVGFRQFCVEYQRPPRSYGEARQTLPKLIRLALDAIFSFSRLPIRVLWGLGSLGILLSIAGTCYVLASKLVFGTALIGWSSLLASIFFLGGIQLVSLGLLGEYQIRIYEELMHRPYYVITRTHGELGRGD